MAKKYGKDEEKLNYAAAVRELKQQGPERVYLLWGPEDYLREQYLVQLKGICLPEGDDSFSYRRMDGPELDLDALRQAMDALPFMTERSFIELRDMDINKLKEAEAFSALLQDVPDYCVVAFVLGADYELDGRLKSVKALRQAAKELKFTNQSQGMLTDWLVRRFAAAGKGIDTGKQDIVPDAEAADHCLAPAVLGDQHHAVSDRDFRRQAGTLFAIQQHSAA